MKNIKIFPIIIYQYLKQLFGLPPSCRFTPSCSEYTREALTRHGIITGSILGVRRILKCHPFSRGGFDPVPNN